MDNTDWGEEDEQQGNDGAKRTGTEGHAQSAHTAEKATNGGTKWRRAEHEETPSRGHAPEEGDVRERLLNN